jgi:hypothetical protein
MNCFSQELIEKTQEYFFSRWGHKVSAEQASDYLRSLADLYLSFVKFSRSSDDGVYLPALTALGDKHDSPDLISPHNC